MKGERGLGDHIKKLAFKTFVCNKFAILYAITSVLQKKYFKKNMHKQRFELKLKSLKIVKI